MKHKIKLQMRKNYCDGGSCHCVYQIQIPIALIRKLGWKKGNVLVLNSPSGGQSISMMKKPSDKSLQGKKHVGKAT